jgi:cyclopropane-fatty-acyl-phospholipid synthase
VLFMAREYGCRTTGISPAPRQHDFIAGRAAELGVTGLVTTQVGHFELADLPERDFDAVSMLGSIVHKPDLDAAFGQARRVLRRSGSLYVSESCFRNGVTRDSFGKRTGTQFVAESIFGWGDMGPLAALIAGAENAGFSIVAVDDLTAHYHRTIEDWRAGVRAARPQMEELAPGYAAELERYLEIANAGWGYTTKHYALTCRNARWE